MYYTYILHSKDHHKFYFGSTKDLKNRLALHNNGDVKSTKYGVPWKLVRYGSFSTEKEARDFENILKLAPEKLLHTRDLSHQC